MEGLHKTLQLRKVVKDLQKELTNKMCRIESQALKDIESTGVKGRIRNSEDRLIESMERTYNHAINRRRLKSGLPELTKPRMFSLKKKEKIRKNIQRLAKAAC